MQPDGKNTNQSENKLDNIDRPKVEYFQGRNK